MKVLNCLLSRHLVLIAGLCFCLAVSVVAQKGETKVVLSNTEKREITSKKIGQTYELLISFPAEYATSGKRYPVLYVLDGWHFPLMAYLQDNNVFSKRMPPVIIVNVSHGDLEFTKLAPLRSRDFRPTAVNERPGSGGAAAFLDFFENELMPLIDRTYRTDITDRGLLGHSAGGVFAIYALEERPSLFQRIVAASPALKPSPELLSAEKLKNIKSPARLDLSMGEEEDSTLTRNFYELLNQVKPPNLEYRLTVYKGENHNSVRLSSFPSGLYWVYQPLAVKSHNK